MTYVADDSKAFPWPVAGSKGKLSKVHVRGSRRLARGRLGNKYKQQVRSTPPQPRANHSLAGRNLTLNPKLSLRVRGLPMHVSPCDQVDDGCGR
jgi:hypothetical protein